MKNKKQFTKQELENINNFWEKRRKDHEDLTIFIRNLKQTL